MRKCRSPTVRSTPSPWFTLRLAGISSASSPCPGSPTRSTWRTLDCTRNFRAFLRAANGARASGCRPAASSRLLLFAQLAKILRNGIRVAGRRRFGGATADAAALLLFQLAAQLQLDLFEACHDLGIDTLGQQRILPKAARINALHVAHQVLHVAGNVRVVAQVLSHPVKVPYGLTIAALNGRPVAIPGAIPTLAPVAAVIAARRSSAERPGLTVVAAR